MLYITILSVSKYKRNKYYLQKEAKFKYLNMNVRLRNFSGKEFYFLRYSEMLKISLIMMKVHNTELESVNSEIMYGITFYSISFFQWDHFVTNV